MGIGNPGKKYKYTPHNIGFSVIDEVVLALQEEDVQMKESHRKRVATYEFSLDDKKIILAKSLVFMNDSGSAIKSLLKDFPLTSLNNLWVIHDDIDLGAGTIRVQLNRGSAGHKGVQNIIDAIHSQDFYRIRIGILPKHLQGNRTKEWMNEFVTKKLAGTGKEEFIKYARFSADLIVDTLKNKERIELGDYDN